MKSTRRFEDEIIKLLREILERLEAIEGMLDLIREELKELREKGPAIRRGKSGGDGLLRVLNERLFLDTREITSRKALQRLLEEGKAILLRDEGANREIVTTKEAIRRIIEKLPLPIEEAAKLDDREYELLVTLNRLGYVLLKDNKYVPTEAVKELI